MSHSAPPDLAEELSFRFLRELPRLPSAADLGVATAGVEPWPHQLKVIRRTAERYPQSFLFCDEVGLGKTIEVALTLRSLWLTGRVTRALVLAPKAVLRQWHEELHEKAFVPAARFDGGAFVDVGGRPLEPARAAANPWDRHDMILASTQTARSPTRRREILRAAPWNLVVVDEAHHARRRQLPGPYRPNRLLELLGGDDGDGGLRRRADALYLLTATPMQIHPLEIWDLLRLLDLGGRWGSDERAFLDFFEQLGRPFVDRDWSLLLELARESGAESTPAVDALRRDGPGAVAASSRSQVDAWLRRSTPIHRSVWRHTRPLLRRYRDAGLLADGVPERRPRNVWIELTPAQRRVYRRIEAYLAEFYQRYEARRRGLGFVMTVYRRRLTSSFTAVRRSLERRRRYLSGENPEPAAAAEVEAEWLAPWGGPGGAQRELELDGPPEGALPTTSVFSTDELGHLDAILDDLAMLRDEPKLDRLDRDLRRFLRRRDRALVFTQYLDTLDALREALRRTFRVACYSGRGGEVFRNGEWCPAPKESLKAAFSAGEVQVLLCTEAASEGLNLQTCGVLINYDMPWNPMRVEQRIGRIDRIGQVHRRVWIRNYFYADTVEATVYERLNDRIQAFRAILGDLQPILHGVGETIERLALTPEARRRRRLEEAVGDLRRRLDDRPADPLPDADGDAVEAEPAARAPVSPRELEALFRNSRTFEGRFAPTSEPGVVTLDAGPGATAPEPVAVTFEPLRFAERPYSLQLLSWGTPLFESLLKAVEGPPSRSEPAGIGLYASRNPAPVSVFAAPGPDGDVEAITDLDALRRAIRSAPGAWRQDQEAAAASLFSGKRRGVLRGLEAVEAARRRTAKRALRAEASELLVRAAVVELLAADNPGLFDAPVQYDWGPDAVPAQAARGGPYPRLLEIAVDPPEARADHPEAVALRGRAPEHLAHLALEVERRGWQVAERWTALLEAEDAARRASTDRSAGLLDRLYFPLGTLDETPSIYVEPRDLEPFRNAIPLLGDVADAAATLAEALADGRRPLAELARAPSRTPWVDPSPRVRPAPDLFAATVPGRVLEPRVPADAVAVLRLDPSPPRDGHIVLVDGLADPETGAAATLRVWRLDAPRALRRRAEHGLQLRLEALHPGVEPLVVDEPGDADLRVVARLVDLLS